MEKFIDKTSSSKEPAVKAGNVVPKEAVNLGWFSSKDVNPKNNLTIVDLSSLIPENINSDETFEKVMFANELGILEDQTGNSYVSSDDVYVTDIFLDKEFLDTNYSLDEINSSKYATSYYISNFFTLVKTTTHFDSNISYYVDKEYIPNSIKVLDKDGNHYVNTETGEAKYRISLESFVTDSNIQSLEIPHKIIVFLEDPNPKNLVLVYDKVECDENGFWSNQFLKYSETINTIPIFRKVEEETEVIDPTNQNDKSFSIKRNSKDANLSLNSSIQEDNQIFVNRKALDDNRVFEVFNWRIVAKLKNSVTFSEVNYGKNINIFDQNSNTVKAAVLYSSSNFGEVTIQSDQFNLDASKINPYVFYNLQNSPFNLFKFNFSNHLSENLPTNSREYWLVDLDQISDENIQSFDVLSLSLYWKLDERQAAKLKSFTKSSGMLIIDASAAPEDGLINLDPRLQISDISSTQVITGPPSLYSETSLLLNSEKNNTFEINQEEFEEDCGIFGYAKTITDVYKNYRSIGSRKYSWHTQDE